VAVWPPKPEIVISLLTISGTVIGSTIEIPTADPGFSTMTSSRKIGFGRHILVAISTSRLGGHTAILLFPVACIWGHFIRARRARERRLCHLSYGTITITLDPVCHSVKFCKFRKLHTCLRSCLTLPVHRLATSSLHFVPSP